MPEEMLAARLVAPGEVEVGSWPMPAAREGELLVRMRRAAICGSDLHVIYDGFSRFELPAPVGYPGHEGVGEVAEGSGGGLGPGDRVLVIPAAGEGGLFAQYVAATPERLVPLPASGDLDRLLMAQQLGTTIFALRRFYPPELEPGRLGVVIGAGSAGLHFLQQLKLRGFERVVVSDVDDGRLEVAQELGADEVVNASRHSVAAAASELSAGVGADLVIEAAGYDASRAEAVDAVRYGGRIGFYGYPETRGLAPFPFNSAFRKSCTMEVCMGTQSEPGLRSMREALDLIASGKIRTEHLLGATYPLAELPTALAAARAHDAIKVHIEL